jgi:hypothetical protein
VNAGPDIQLVSASFPASTNMAAAATDDGLPSPPGKVSYQWTQVSGPGQVVFQNSTNPSTPVSFPGVGVYVLRVTGSDGEYAVSDDVSVTISRPLAAPVFVAQRSTWKYLDNGSDQQTAWRNPDFQDGGWKSGPAILGYGDPVATTIGYGPNSGNKYPTTYFRRSFNVTGAANVTGLSAKVLRDDGVIVYINGVEAFRSNMPIGPVNYTTYASSVVGGGDETAYFNFTLDPALLREGNNVIAVELHQANAGSSDLSFDLELDGLANFSNQPPTANAGPDLTVDLPSAAALNGVATDDGLPNPPGVYNATWSTVNGPGSVSFADAHAPVTTAAFSVGGTYVLRLAVTDGELTATDDVTVTVRGNDPYITWKSAHFTASELADINVSGDGADPDKDQFTNQQEYIAGTDPKDTSSFLHVEEADVNGADFVLRFEAAGDKSYSILGREALSTGSWSRVVDLSPQGASGTTQNLEVLDTMRAGQTEKYYRIVTPQLPPQ